MTVEQLIDLAKQGELKNIAVKDDTLTVLGYLNLGLIELYKRFPLKTSEIIITLGEDGDVDNPYTKISDTIYEMPEDYLYILEAYEEVPVTSSASVLPVPINEEDNPLSINTVSWNQVQIPVPTPGSHISIIYNTAPPYLTGDDLVNKLPVPLQLVEALLHYIGYKGHASVSSNVQGENNTHYQRFEASCQKAETLGVLTSDDMSMSGRVSSRGFI